MLIISYSAYYTIAERAGHVKLQPRSTSPLGLVSAYDGNIIGGSLLGAGMALSGSCPGTLFAQMAGGVHTGFHALNGAVLGGILWTGFVGPYVARRRASKSLKAEVVSISSQLGLSRGATLVLLEVALGGVIAATVAYTPQLPGAVISGAVGGLLIGLTQLLSIVTRRSMMGISGSFEEAGNLFWATVKGDSKPKALPNMLFAASAALGAFVLAKAVPAFTYGTPFEVPPAMATLGGVLMVVGARLAGGCTSGHGISGISLLSTSSIVTIASTFAVGSVVAKLAY